MDDVIYNMKEKLLIQRETEIDKIQYISGDTTMNALQVNFRKICALDQLIRSLDQMMKDPKQNIKNAANENNRNFD